MRDSLSELCGFRLRRMRKRAIRESRIAAARREAEREMRRWRWEVEEAVWGRRMEDILAGKVGSEEGGGGGGGVGKDGKNEL